MSILTILKYPDPRLREKSREVENFDEGLKLLAQDMVETMLAAPGAGLAAPQVGKSIKMIVVSQAPNGAEFDESHMVLVNPRISCMRGEQVFEEGCLSVTDLHEKVIRAMEVEVDAQDLDGNPLHIQAEGRQAVILQHEIDHLDGILFLDHLSSLKRDIYKRRLKKIQKESVND